MSEVDKRKQAEEYVGKLGKFYRHLAVYLIVNIALTIFNFMHEPNNLWFYWIWLFWGISIVLQAISLFGPAAKIGKEWQEKKIKDYMKKK